MYPLKKIFLILVLMAGCFQMVEAKKQKKKSAAKKTQQTTRGKQKSKGKSSKKSAVKYKSGKPTTKKKQISSMDADVQSAKIEREALSDTSNPKEVVITSAFKPSLKSAAKINFTAATPLVDSTKLLVSYKIPSQNLFFSYQPVSIKPIALGADSAYSWQNEHYIKVGVGNFSTPFAEAGFSFGDGVNSMIAIHANHVDSKGKLNFQEFGKTGVDILSIFNTKTNHEWTSKAFYNSSTQYYYGFQPVTLPYTKDDLLQRYNTVGLEIGLQNKQLSDYGLLYHPQLNFTYFSDNHKANETNLVMKLPFNKSFGDIYGFNMGVTADIASYNSPVSSGPVKINNNLVYIDPSVQFHTPNFKLNIGVQPSWDNQNFAILPNLTAEARINETGINVELGWVGYYNKNSYRSLAGMNPWIEKPLNISNTKIGEQYLGFKGTAGNHLTYQARLSFMQFYNQALFVNNSTDGKSFNVIYDPKIQALRLHGELGYNIQEKFSFTGALNLTEYTSLTTYDKAYGLIPMELTGTFKWKILKDLQIKADAFFQDGSAYQNKQLQSQKLAPAADINLGAEFAVLPKLNIWLQMNNLLNNTYQRWNQYEVLGFNVLGGVVYSFK